ncbi:sugar phosphate isomerase/epimerase family protein [Granulosicoccus antarcticus]|uniref:Xylose isomerase-like TIM barrel domain-containing protein n=1 Tax=Granulosicoccus antarcticus IMCC3135 TaxID=1192854 RepID=A0A2Z2NR49_9GAMM|nr:sugar phosphate isomerase/epimerase [Granulosicoccus antarcticus]ASJ73813.1 hypothetical protein IMCC3135_18670 [Granulosicoccus antarcticus IMCC3135]
MKPIAYQLYSSRNHDLDSTLSMLARLGITELEGYAPLYQDINATRNRLDKNQLTMPTGHFAIEQVESDPTGCIAIARSLGLESIIVPFLTPDQRPVDAAGWQQLATRVTEMGKPVRDAGLGFGWHNHDFEFLPLDDGTLPIEYLLEAAPQIELELDLAWVHVAGQNPVNWIKRLTGQILAVHLKDCAPEGENLDEDGWADVGYGIMDWEVIAAALKLAKVPRFIIEHDNPSDPERFARRSLATVEGL